MQVVIAGTNDSPCDNSFFLINVSFNLEQSSSKDGLAVEKLIKLNPWRYSYQESRPIEAVHAR